MNYGKNNRHHTMVVTFTEGFVSGIMLEKDWFSPTWAGAHKYHYRVVRKQGTFHLLSNSCEIFPEAADLWVDNAILGNLKTIDLREYSSAKARESVKRVR